MGNVRVKRIDENFEEMDYRTWNVGDRVIRHSSGNWLFVDASGPHKSGRTSQYEKDYQEFKAKQEQKQILVESLISSIDYEICGIAGNSFKEIAEILGPEVIDEIKAVLQKQLEEE